jgi:protein SCO1/2
MSQRARGLRRSFLALSMAAAPSLADHTPGQQMQGATAGWPIGDFFLADQNGNPFVRQSLDGRWTLLVLGDSRCAAGCAAALSAAAGLLRRIARTQAAQTTQVVLLSLRPDDRTADMRRVLAPHGAGFLGVTGPSEQLAGLADDLGINTGGLAEQASVTPREQAHTDSIWLIGPDGVIRTELLPPFDVPLLTAAYLKTRLRG